MKYTQKERYFPGDMISKINALANHLKITREEAKRLIDDEEYLIFHEHELEVFSWRRRNGETYFIKKQ